MTLTNSNVTLERHGHLARERHAHDLGGDGQRRLGHGRRRQAAARRVSTLNGNVAHGEQHDGRGHLAVSTGGTVTLNLASGDVGHNGGGGITLSAGAGTLGAVNVHQNTGAGITQSGGTLTLGSGGTTTVQTNTGDGRDAHGRHAHRRHRDDHRQHD